MSNRLVKHSSRYKGPAGDSRPASEIFAGIEARAQENAGIHTALTAALDIALKSRQHASFDDRIALIKGVCRDWLFKNDPELRTSLALEGLDSAEVGRG